MPTITETLGEAGKGAGDALKTTGKTTVLALGTTLAALVPSASTVTTVGAGAFGVAMLASCETDEVDPNAIDYTTDNPKHKEEFMKDVKSVTVGAITTNYNAIWNGSGYQLVPKSHEINTENAISWMKSR